MKKSPMWLLIATQFLMISAISIVSNEAWEKFKKRRAAKKPGKTD